MQKLFLMTWIFLLLLPMVAVSQVVSIYCTWDDLEAARQERIFGSGIVTMLRQAGYSVTDKSFPNQQAANSAITSNIRLVIGSSHGDEWTFYDCNDWTAIWRSNPMSGLAPLQGKIVHLLACLNGKDLAPTMVAEASTTAVLAYTETFNFSGESKYNTLNALADAEFDRALVQENCTTEEAYLKAKNKFIDYANDANNEGNDMEYETFMHNANCISLFGDKTARIIPGTRVSTLAVATKVRKFKKPSEAILSKLYMAKSGSTPLHFSHYRSGRFTAGTAKHYKSFTQAELRDLCLARYQNAPDTYRLGMRSFQVQLMDKNQILSEIQNNTKVGAFLIRRYKAILETVEKILEE